MLLSLSEQADSRKSRLAKLREDRKLEKESTGDVQTQSNLDQSTNGATQDNSTNESNPHHTHNNSVRSRNFDLETRDAVSGIKKPPTLALSNNETVEVLASQIQRDILQDIRYKADAASNRQDEESPLEKHDSAYHSKDLKADLAYYFNKADTKTNQAINKILQTKYENSLH